MNKFLKIIIIVIVSIVALGIVVAGGGAKSGNSFVPLLAIAIFVVIYFVFREKSNDS